MRVLVLTIASIVMLAIGSAKAVALGPPAPAHRHVLCYMGRVGQPSHCVTIIVGGRPVS